MKKSNLDTWICETENLPQLTRSDLEALQFSRLNDLLRREHELGRFYRNLPRQLRSPEELRSLPFTTPQMLAHHDGSFLLTSQSQVSRVISGATSGTTGPAKRIFYTERDTAHTITFFAAGIAEMVGPGDRVLITFPFSGAFGLGDLIEQAVVSLNAKPLRIGARKTYREICDFLSEEKPDCYIGFPVPLLSLARFYSFGIHHSVGSNPVFPIKRALISGDACSKGVVDALEQLLQSRLFPHYGSREMGLGGAVTCPAHEGMHLRENHIIAEIIGKDLRPVPDGQWGELVITTIGLEAMPLIRYRTGDYTRFLPDPCPCKSVTKRLDMVSRMGDSSLSMEALDSILFPIGTLVDYRARLDKKELTILAYTLDGSSQALIVDKLRERYSSFRIHIQEKICQPDDTALYAGKRYIMNTELSGS